MVVSTPAIARTGPIDRMYGGPEIINRCEVASDTFHLATSRIIIGTPGVIRSDQCSLRFTAKVMF